MRASAVDVQGSGGEETFSELVGKKGRLDDKSSILGVAVGPVVAVPLELPVLK